MSDDKFENRIVYYDGLVIPNPREYTKNTRSFEDMRLEYDLLHGHEFTEEDLRLVMNASYRTHGPFWHYLPLLLLPIVLYVLLLTLR